MAGVDEDLFVIHTKGTDSQGRKLPSEVFDWIEGWCGSVGLRVVGYEDWEWDPPHEPPPDALGLVPSPTEDPWLHLPIIDTDSLRGYWRACDVLVIVESGPLVRHSAGVSIELKELLRWVPEQPPPAVAVAITLGDSPTEEVAALARSWIRLDSARDLSVGSLIAVAWLVSRLQRSGSAGLEILNEAGRSSSLVEDLGWFGPDWRALPVDEVATRAPIESWWSEVTALDAFMKGRAHGALSAAWLALTGAVEAESGLRPSGESHG